MLGTTYCTYNTVILGRSFITGSGSERAAHCCSYGIQVFNIDVNVIFIMSKSGTSVTVLIACHVAVSSPAAMACSIAAHSKLRPSADLLLCCLGVCSLVCVESLFGESCDSLQLL